MKPETGTVTMMASGVNGCKQISKTHHALNDLRRQAAEKEQRDLFKALAAKAAAETEKVQHEAGAGCSAQWLLRGKKRAQACANAWFQQVSFH